MMSYFRYTGSLFFGYALFVLALMLPEVHEKSRRKDWVKEKSA